LLFFSRHLRVTNFGSIQKGRLVESAWKDRFLGRTGRSFISLSVNLCPTRMQRELTNKQFWLAKFSASKAIAMNLKEALKRGKLKQLPRSMRSSPQSSIRWARSGSIILWMR